MNIQEVHVFINHGDHTTLSILNPHVLKDTDWDALQLLKKFADDLIKELSLRGCYEP